MSAPTIDYRRFAATLLMLLDEIEYQAVVCDDMLAVRSLARARFDIAEDLGLDVDPVSAPVQVGHA